MAEIEEIRLLKSPLGYEIRIDWSNERHHAAIVEPPYSGKKVRSALIRLATLAGGDHHVNDD